MYAYHVVIHAHIYTYIYTHIYSHIIYIYTHKINTKVPTNKIMKAIQTIGKTSVLK